MRKSRSVIRACWLAVLTGLTVLPLCAAPSPAYQSMVDAILKKLHSTDAEVRAKAAEQLGQLGPGTPGAASALIESLLKDTDQRVQIAAADSLGEFEPAAVKVVPALISSTKKSDAWEVIRANVRSLGKMGPKASGAVPVLVKVLKKGDLPGQSAAYALGKIGPVDRTVVPALVEALTTTYNAYSLCRVSAADALGEFGPSATKAIPALQKAEKDTDLLIQDAAKRALARIRGKSVPPPASRIGKKTSLETLIAEAGKDDESRSKPAAIRLGQMGEAAEPAIPTLEKAALNYGETEFYSIQALGRIGPKASGALFRLLKAKNVNVQNQVLRVLPLMPGTFGAHLEDLSLAVKDEDEDVAKGSVQLLAQAGAPAVPYLKKALEDKRPGVAQLAGEGLRDLGGGGQDTIPALVSKLGDANNDAASAAASALVAMKGKAVPALTDALKSPSSETRRHALWALGAIGPEAEPALPTLFKVWDDPNKDVRYQVCMALGNIGPKATDFLLQKLERIDLERQDCVTDTLVALGKNYKETGPLFLKGLRNPKPLIRKTCAQALGERKDLTEAEVLGLAQSMSDPDESVRSTAAWSLGACHTTSPAVLPVLKTGLKDTNAGVRAWCLVTLTHFNLSEEGLVPTFIQLTNDPNDMVQIRAMSALDSVLESIPSTDPPYLSTLGQILKADNPKARGYAVRKLTLLKPRLEETTRLLTLASQDKDPLVAKMAQDALKQR